MNFYFHWRPFVGGVTVGIAIMRPSVVTVLCAIFGVVFLALEDE